MCCKCVIHNSCGVALHRLTECLQFTPSVCTCRRRFETLTNHVDMPSRSICACMLTVQSHAETFREQQAPLAAEGAANGRAELQVSFTSTSARIALDLKYVHTLLLLWCCAAVCKCRLERGPGICSCKCLWPTLHLRTADNHGFRCRGLESEAPGSQGTTFSCHVADQQRCAHLCMGSDASHPQSLFVTHSVRT